MLIKYFVNLTFIGLFCLGTYVNAYSSSDDIQRAFVKVLLGEIPAMGKSPVALKGFFDREV